MNEYQDSVSYWRMCQPQITSAAHDNEEDSSDEKDYETLYLQEKSSTDLLKESKYYKEWIPLFNVEGETIYRISCSLFVKLILSLIKRFTNVKSNWETKTLQSILEVGCWLGVIYGGYMAYHDFVWSLQLGTFIGMMVSICDEVLSNIVANLLHSIHQQPWGHKVLEYLGFQVNKKLFHSTKGDALYAKTIVFGYLGLATISWILRNINDIALLCFLMTLTSIMFVAAGELYDHLYLIREIGLTLEGRWLRILENWQCHFFRSLFEVTAWLFMICTLFYMTNTFLWSVEIATLVAVIVCLCSGLDTHTTSGGIPNEEEQLYEYAERHYFYILAEVIVQVENVLLVLDCFLAKKAKLLMEDFSE